MFNGGGELLNTQAENTNTDVAMATAEFAFATNRGRPQFNNHKYDK